jgi:hypothetical protein
MADPHKAQSVKQTNETAHQRRSLEPIGQEWVGLEPFDLTTLQRSADNPGLAWPDDILKLQRAYGNQAVTCLIRPSAPTPALPSTALPSTALGTGGTGRTGKLRVQAKLMVGSVGDKYEQEADRVAEQVVGLVASPSYKPIQRREEEEELAQTKLALHRFVGLNQAPPHSTRTCSRKLSKFRKPKARLMMPRMARLMPSTNPWVTRSSK